MDITKNNYTILATIDLTDKSSVKNMYATLESIKKDYFEPNERILVIHSDQNNPLLLASLDELLLALNIPNFLIIHETVDIPVDDSYTFYLNDNFCFYPWTNFRFNPDGTVYPCCRYSKNLSNVDSPYNIKVNKVKQIYLSDEMHALRQKFKKNIWPSECNLCKIDEQANLLSLRKQTKIKYFDIFHTTNYQDEEIGNLQILDLNLGNECNLSCRICSPMFSSTIAKEQEELLQIQHTPLIKATDDYINNLLEVAQNIKYLNIQGGEPLMSKKHWDFLEKLVELGYSKHIKIDCATNGTFYSDRFLNIWNQFEKVKLTFSVDDTGQRFEYQRNGANWSEVENNIKKYTENRSNKLVLGIHPAVSIQNVYYLPELVKWIESLDLPYSFNVVKYPDHLSIIQLDSAVKEKICQKLIKFNSNKEIQAVINLLTQSTGHTKGEFFNYMKKLDQHRKQNFADAHSEIAKIIGLI